MKRFFALLLVVALVNMGVPALVSGAPETLTGRIAGSARSQTGQPLVNYTVQVRNVATGQLVGTARTSVTGDFVFDNLAAGHYVGEVLDAAGRIVATSASLTLARGAMSLGGVAITAGGAQGTQAAGGAGAFFKSTAGILLLVAAGVGTTIAIIVATRGEESPSK